MSDRRVLTLEDAVAILRREVARFPTQREAADAMGVCRQHLSRVLGGSNPGPRVLRFLGLRRAMRATYVQEKRG